MTPSSRRPSFTLLAATCLAATALLVCSCSNGGSSSETRTQGFFQGVKRIVLSDYDAALSDLQESAAYALEGLDTLDYARSVEDLYAKVSIYRDSIEALRQEAKCRAYDVFNERFKERYSSGRWSHISDLLKKRGEGMLLMYDFGDSQVQVLYELRNDTCFWVHTLRHGNPDYAPQIAQIDTLLAERLDCIELGRLSVGSGFSCSGDYTKYYDMFEIVVDAIEEVCRRQEMNR